MKLLGLFLFFCTTLAALQTQEDLERLSFFQSLGTKNSSSDRPVPKIFHWIWLGSTPFPEELKPILRKWQETHRDWRFVFWTDVEGRKAPLPSMEARQVADFVFGFLEKPFCLAKSSEERTKLLAYEVLYKEGGVYLDPECSCVGQLDEKASFYCGLEDAETSLLSSNVYPSTRLMAAAPAHEVIEAAMQWLLERWQELEEKHPGDSASAVLSRTMHRTFWALSEGLERAGQEARVLSAEELKKYALYPKRGNIKKQEPHPPSSADFDLLCGKELPCFAYLEKDKDLQFLRLCKALYTHIPQTKKQIPKTLHFIWLGPNPFPPGSVENVRSFVAKHPGWKIKFWTDRLRDPPCNSMEVVFAQALSQRYASSENWGEKADLLRLEILQKEGGLYVDHDVYCLQSFDSFHDKYDFYTGLEMPHSPVGGRCLTAGNAVIGAKPGHPLLGRTLQLIDERWERLERKYRGQDGYSRTQKVMERTYLAFTEALEQGVPEGGVIFPSAYFFSKGKVKPLYCKHFCANRWANEEEKPSLEQKKERKALTHLKKRVRLLSHTSWALSGLILVAFALLFYTWRKRAV